MPRFPEQLGNPPPLGTPARHAWEKDYAIWFVTVADRSGIDGLRRFRKERAKENANPPSVPSVRRLR